MYYDRHISNTEGRNLNKYILFLKINNDLSHVMNSPAEPTPNVNPYYLSETTLFITSKYLSAKPSLIPTLILPHSNQTMEHMHYHTTLNNHTPYHFLNNNILRYMTHYHNHHKIPLLLVK